MHGVIMMMMIMIIIASKSSSAKQAALFSHHPCDSSIIIATIMKNPSFPSLPLLCLQTACETSTLDVFKGRNTVIGTRRA
jgi:hypothetical protein